MDNKIKQMSAYKVRTPSTTEQFRFLADLLQCCTKSGLTTKKQKLKSVTTPEEFLLQSR